MTHIIWAPRGVGKTTLALVAGLHHILMCQKSAFLVLVGQHDLHTRQIRSRFLEMCRHIAEDYPRAWGLLHIGLNTRRIFFYDGQPWGSSTQRLIHVPHPVNATLATVSAQSQTRGLLAPDGTRPQLIIADDVLDSTQWSTERQMRLILERLRFAGDVSAACRLIVVATWDERSYETLATVPDVKHTRIDPLVVHDTVALHTLLGSAREALAKGEQHWLSWLAGNLSAARKVVTVRTAVRGAETEAYGTILRHLAAVPEQAAAELRQQSVTRMNRLADVQLVEVEPPADAPVVVAVDPHIALGCWALGLTVRDGLPVVIGMWRWPPIPLDDAYGNPWQGYPDGLSGIDRVVHAAQELIGRIRAALPTATILIDAATGVLTAPLGSLKQADNSVWLHFPHVPGGNARPVTQWRPRVGERILAPGIVMRSGELLSDTSAMKTWLSHLPRIGTIPGLPVRVLRGHLASEVPVQRGANIRWQQLPNQPNHLLDCLVMAAAGLIAIGALSAGNLARKKKITVIQY